MRALVNKLCYQIIRILFHSRFERTVVLLFNQNMKILIFKTLKNKVMNVSPLFEWWLY
jgi:hypothetical protein